MGVSLNARSAASSGEKLATPADVERAAEIAKTAGLARARVLERVAPLDEP